MFIIDSWFSLRVPRPFSGKGIRNSLQQMMLGQLDIHIKRMNLDPLPPYYITKIISKWQRPKCKSTVTIKLLGKSISINCHVFELGNGFLEMTQKAHATKEKIDKQHQK